jgi:hypothetical protein
MANGEIVEAIVIDLETGEIRDLAPTDIYQRLNQLAEKAAEVKIQLESYEQAQKEINAEAANLLTLIPESHKHALGNFVMVHPSTNRNFDEGRLEGLIKTLKKAGLHTLALAIENCKVTNAKKGYTYFKLNRS